MTTGALVCFGPAAPFKVTVKGRVMVPKVLQTRLFCKSVFTVRKSVFTVQKSVFTASKIRIYKLWIQIYCKYGFSLLKASFGAKASFHQSAWEVVKVSFLQSAWEAVKESFLKMRLFCEGEFRWNRKMAFPSSGNLSNIVILWWGEFPLISLQVKVWKPFSPSSKLPFTEKSHIP